MEIYAQGEKIVEEKTMVDKLMVSQDGREVIQKLADLRQSLKTAKMMVWQGRFMQFSEKGMEFTNCVSDVASSCPELDLVHYQEILKKNGIAAVNGKTAAHIQSLQKVNLADELTFRNDRQTTYFVKDGKSIRQVAVTLGEGAILKKHTTDVPATLIMVKGEVRFLINGEEIILKDLDTYQIPVEVEHEVIGVQKENIFIITKQLAD